MAKILLVANTGWYLYNFRLPLARHLRSIGLEVVFVSPSDAYVQRLTSEGFRHVGLRLGRQSMNPLRDLDTLLNLFGVYWCERPRAVHHFTIKCVLYGTIAAKLAGVRSVVNAVTGLGSVFSDNRFSLRMLNPFVRVLYRTVLRSRRAQVIFQNPDDLNSFVSAGLVAPEKTTLIRSSGVDTKRFSPRAGGPDEPPARIVLFASRILREKGIYEFVEAARLLKSRGYKVTFQVAGEPDQGNPGAVPAATLEAWRKEGAIDFLGHVDGIERVMAQASIVVLPSYREGVPKVLIEAASMGKVIVTADSPGCREVVIDGHNGLLVPPCDATALSVAIQRLLDEPATCREMGLRGRSLAVECFDEKLVIGKTVELYVRCGIPTQCATVC